MKIDLSDKEVLMLQKCMCLLPRDARFTGMGYEEVNRTWDKLWYKLTLAKTEGKEKK